MTRLLSTLLLLALAAPAAAALYKWTDGNGRVHFSDTPPDRQQKAEVLQAPVATPPATITPAAGPPGTGDTAQRDRERRLREAWREEAEQKEREAALNAAREAERAAKCAKLRRELQAMEGRAIYFTKESGEKEFLDDAARRAYTEKAQRQLQEHCS